MATRRRWRWAAVSAVGTTTTLLAGALVASRAAHAADTRNWVIEHAAVNVAKAQEGNDEFYLAVVSFRSTPGKAGSTSVTYNGHLQEIKVKKDQTKAIPTGMGLVSFPNVTRLGLAEVGAMQAPELLGAITIAFESDATSFSTMDGFMRKVRDAAKKEIANVVEPLTFNDLKNPKDVADRVKGATERIKNAGKPAFLDKLGTWVTSFGDPDDKINSRVELFAAVDETAGTFPLNDQGVTIDGQLGDVMFSSGAGGMLTSRTYTLDYAGDGADYRVVTTVHPV